ncbi:MAG: Rab family GTPase [Pseudomonadota bacterium]
MTARKVMLLGEIGVGKSSLVRRLTLNQFDFNYKPTLGVNIYTYDVPEDVLQQRTTLIIWDTDGNMRQSIFRHVYMREASAALIIGDVTRPGTLDVMTELGDGFREAFPGRKHGFVINKSDLLQPGEAPSLPESLKARERDVIITSAKTGDNVEAAFHTLAAAIIRRDQ